MSDSGIDVRQSVAVVCVLAVLAAGCGGDAASPGTSTTVPETTTTTETSETSAFGDTGGPARPNGPPFLEPGDSGPFVTALQHLLNCDGHGPIGVDGMFGNETAGAVQSAQRAEGKEPTGAPDEETFAALSRACSEDRGIAFAAGSITADVAGNAAPGDPDRFSLWALEGQDMTIRIWSGADVEVGVKGLDGTTVHLPDGAAEFTTEIPSSQMYVIEVAAGEPTSYALTIAIPPLLSPEVDLDATLEWLFDTVTAGDIATALGVIAPEVVYHGADDTTHDGMEGTEALAQALTLLSQGPNLVSRGVSGREGELIVFEAATVEEDPEVLRFAARVIGDAIVEWWDQPAMIEDTLQTVFLRARLGDVDGAMTLFDMDGVTYERVDGMVFEGLEGRSALRQSLEGGRPLVFVEIIEHTGSRATFSASSIGADPEAFVFTALFGAGIQEWRELPNGE